ncbi:hypothetical protein CsatB_020015 [Cannabis sativa]
MSSNTEQPIPPQSDQQLISNNDPQISNHNGPEVTTTGSNDPVQVTSSIPQNGVVGEETNANNSIFYKNKIFIGGLPHVIDETEVKAYFTTFGEVLKTQILRDVATGRGRGFGFITFSTEEAVEQVLKNNFHNLKNKLVEVKRAKRKETNRVGGVLAQSNINNNNNNMYCYYNSNSINNNYYNYYYYHNNYINELSIYNPRPIIMPVNPPVYPNYPFSHPHGPHPS